MEKVNRPQKPELNQVGSLIPREIPKNVNELKFEGKMRDKLVTEIRMLMNIENFVLPKFYGGEFYAIFRKLLNETKTNTNHAHKNKTYEQKSSQQ